MNIGILHPGSMGVSVAASAVSGGHRVMWASAGRSAASVARANEHGLVDGGTLAEIVASSEVIISVCPPAAAIEVADSVAAAGFKGTYVDCNAISPMRMNRIAEQLQQGGARVVDAGIIGNPAWVANKTFLYLSGDGAEEVAALFDKGLLVTKVMAGRKVGDASAMKMCYAAYTKGTTAIVCAILAAADELGVRDEINAHWNMDQAGRAAERERSVSLVTQKAWRWVDEMHEIAATFASVGQPDGFHEAAAELYTRLDGLKDGPHPTPVDTVLAALKQKA